MKWFKKISLQIKFAFVVIGGIVAAFLYFYIKGNLKFKSQLEYELSKIKKQSELALLEDDSKEKEEKINDLKKEEKLILEKIEYIEQKEIGGEEVSIEELEDFFAKRGF
jgi:cell division protein FtsB